jgi:hypothetical protein
MFHFFITLAYIVPNIYLFFRIKDLFISKSFRLWYVIVYLLLAAFYPLFGRDRSGDMNLIMQVLTTISGYILPFYLYLFLFILLFDLFLLLNSRFRIVSSNTRKSFSFRFYTLTTVVFLSVAVVVAGAVNLNTIKVSKYQIDVPGRKARMDHLRIAFVSDFHIQQNTPQRFIEQFVRKVNALQPDLILYGGDMLEGDRENETSEKVESLLRNVHLVFPGIMNSMVGRKKEVFFKRQESLFFVIL